MTRESIAKSLRRLRTNKKMSVLEVQSELLKHDVEVSNKTIYGWESGKRLPDADTFLILCGIYDSSDILKDFGYTNSTNNDYITTIAAHNDYANTKEEQRLMQEDLEDM